MQRDKESARAVMWYGFKKMIRIPEKWREQAGKTTKQAAAWRMLNINYRQERKYYRHVERDSRDGKIITVEAQRLLYNNKWFYPERASQQNNNILALSLSTVIVHTCAEMCLLLAIHTFYRYARFGT